MSCLNFFLWISYIIQLWWIFEEIGLYIEVIGELFGSAVVLESWISVTITLCILECVRTKLIEIFHLKFLRWLLLVQWSVYLGLVLCEIIISFYDIFEYLAREVIFWRRIGEIICHLFLLLIVYAAFNEDYFYLKNELHSQELKATELATQSLNPNPDIRQEVEIDRSQQTYRIRYNDYNSNQRQLQLEQLQQYQQQQLEQLEQQQQQQQQEQAHAYEQQLQQLQMIQSQQRQQLESQLQQVQQQFIEQFQFQQQQQLQQQYQPLNRQNYGIRGRRPSMDQIALLNQQFPQDNRNFYQHNVDYAPQPIIRIEGQDQLLLIPFSQHNHINYNANEQSSGYRNIDQQMNQLEQLNSTLNSRDMANTDEGNSCPICYEVYEKKNGATYNSRIDQKLKLFTLPCGHIFHSTCLRLALLNSQKKCPYCRQVIFKKINILGQNGEQLSI